MDTFLPFVVLFMFTEANSTSQTSVSSAETCLITESVMWLFSFYLLKPTVLCLVSTS